MIGYIATHKHCINNITTYYIIIKNRKFISSVYELHQGNHASTKV